MSKTNPTTRLGFLVAEFVVVVLGVAVGLAVDAWREGRHDTAIEIGYLERLKDNLEADTAAFGRAVEINSVRVPMVGAFLAVADGTEPLPDDPSQFVGYLVASQHADFSGARRDTYDELISQGDLGRLSSRAVRAALADYYTTIEEAQSTQWVEWKETAALVEVTLIQRLPWEVYRWAQVAGTADARVVRDQAELAYRAPTEAEARQLLAQSRRDDALRNLLHRQSLVQARLAAVHASWAVLAEEILTSLDAELARLRGS